MSKYSNSKLFSNTNRIFQNKFFYIYIIYIFISVVLVITSNRAYFLTSLCAQTNSNDKTFETDTFTLPNENLQITFIGHASLMLNWGNTIIHVDPWSKLADYSQFPKADLIIITHNHFDHFDKACISQLSKDDTTVISPRSCQKILKKTLYLNNNETANWKDFKITAFPAYNILHKNSTNKPYHPKGEGNGYTLTKDNFTIYIAGDTENVPEMRELKNINIAFLPMNLPFTMTPEMVASAALSFMPKYLYPYHYGNTNPQEVVTLLKNFKDIEVRIRNMQ